MRIIVVHILFKRTCDITLFLNIKKFFFFAFQSVTNPRISPPNSIQRILFQLFIYFIALPLWQQPKLVLPNWRSTNPPQGAKVVHQLWCYCYCCYYCYYCYCCCCCYCWEKFVIVVIVGVSFSFRFRRIVESRKLLGGFFFFGNVVLDFVFFLVLGFWTEILHIKIF